MKKYVCIPSGVCSTKMEITLDGNIIKKIVITGGCPGNSFGLSRLCEEKNVNEVIELLDGIKCGNKSTSCPDQLAKALKQCILMENKTTD